MIKLMLNRRKPYNYAFFCPVSRLHLTLSNPVGTANEVTSAILRGLKSGVLVDVEGVVDLKTGKVIKTDNKPAEQPKPAEIKNPIIEEPQLPTEDIATESKELGVAPDLPAVDNSADTEQENTEETKTEKAPAKKSSKKGKK